MVSYKKKTQNSRPNPRKGMKTDSLLKVAVNIEKTWIFVSGLASETKAEDVINFLKKYNLDENCFCEKMITRKDRQYSSFKVGVPKKNSEAVLSEDLWPLGTTINHFLHIQRQMISTRKR